MRRLSVANVVAATLVTVTTLVLGTYGAVEYASRSKEEWTRLRLVTRSQTNELAVALALPMWNIDRAQIEKILDSQAQVRPIEGVVVAGAGKTHARVRDDQRRFVASDGVFPTAGLLKEEQPITFAGEQIGTVRLYATPKLIEQQLRTVLIRTVILILAIDVLLILFVYLVLWRTVLRPLMNIERYAVAVSAGGKEKAEPAAAGSAAELESLRSSIETMVGLLELREERFRSIFESVNDAIFILDAGTGAILDVNARMCEMFGYTREEATRTDLGSLSSGTPPYTLENAVERIRSLAPGDHQLIDWQGRHRDGHLLWLEINLRSAIIGGVRRVVSVVRDVTERREMEDALRRSERMSAMGALVAGVAHEVRNPLFGIAAALDAFEAEFGGGDEVADYMNALRNDVSRLNRLMQDLLDYGRPHEIDRHEQSIRPVLAEAVRVCTPRAREKRIEIRQQIAGDLPDAAVDADRMLQVFKNVVENAIEFSEAGAFVTIGAREERNGAPSPALVFTVADRGPGFPPEDVAHVFEPFFTRRPGGNGLGLAIAQKIVAEHDGTIAAMNAADGGGMIEIRLPL